MIFNQAHHDRLNRRLDHHNRHLDTILRSRPNDAARGAAFDMQLAEAQRALACFEEQIAAYERARVESVLELAERARRADAHAENCLRELHEFAARAA